MVIYRKLEHGHIQDTMTWSLTGKWNMGIDRELNMVIDRKMEHGYRKDTRTWS